VSFDCIELQCLCFSFGRERKNRDFLFATYPYFLLQQAFYQSVQPGHELLGPEERNNWLNLPANQARKSLTKITLCTVNIWFGLSLTDKKL